jgi:hypothetical protein
MKGMPKTGDKVLVTVAGQDDPVEGIVAGHAVVEGGVGMGAAVVVYLNGWGELTDMNGYLLTDASCCKVTR